MSWVEIVVSIGISIFAALVFWILSKFFLINNRKKIHAIICAMREENVLYEKALEYNDYNTAVLCANRLLDKLGEIYFSILPLTYFCKKKKLINTIICTLQNQYDSFLRKEEGYSGETEKDVCCEKTLNNLNIVGYSLNKNLNYYDSVNKVLIEILYFLNLRKMKTINNILSNDISCFKFDINSIEDKKTLFKDALFDGNYLGVLKQGMQKDIQKQFYFTTNTLTANALKKIINKIYLSEHELSLIRGKNEQ